MIPNVSQTIQGGLGPVRGREAPCTPSANLPPSGHANKRFGS